MGDTNFTGDWRIQVLLVAPKGLSGLSNGGSRGPVQTDPQKVYGGQGTVIYVCMFFASILIGSKYGIFPYIWLIFMVNVSKYTIRGS